MVRKHGTITAYTTHKCRCKLCRAGWATYQRKWKKANRAKCAAGENRYRQAVVDSRDETGRASLIQTHGLPGSYTSGCRCAECTRANTEKQIAYYYTPEGLEQHRKQRRNRTERRRDWMDNQKRSWCLDCGFVGPPECFDFDHRPSEEKLDNVATLLRGGRPLHDAAQEILKCDLVCANCHRQRSRRRALNPSLIS